MLFSLAENGGAEKTEKSDEKPLMTHPKTELLTMVSYNEIQRKYVHIMHEQMWIQIGF